MHSCRTLIAAAAVTLAVASQAIDAQRVTGAHPDRVVPTPVTLNHTGAFQDKFARVGTDLYISGQPTADAIRRLHADGVTTIVNLRTPAEMARVGFNEAALADSLGMLYVYLPVRGDSAYPYTPATVTAFAAAIKNARGAVLLHCTIAWRASHLWAAYLIRERGVPAESALAQARLVNLMDDMRHTDGLQPVEEFLDRNVTELRKPAGQRAP